MFPAPLGPLAGKTCGRFDEKFRYALLVVATSIFSTFNRKGPLTDVTGLQLCAPLAGRQLADAAKVPRRDVHIRLHVILNVEEIHGSFQPFVASLGLDADLRHAACAMLASAFVREVQVEMLKLAIHNVIN